MKVKIKMTKCLRLNIICIVNKSNYYKLSSIQIREKLIFKVNDTFTEDKIVSKLAKYSKLDKSCFIYKETDTYTDGANNTYLLINFPDYEIDRFIYKEDNDTYIDLIFIDEFVDKHTIPF